MIYICKWIKYCIYVLAQGEHLYYYPPDHASHACNTANHTYLKQPEPDQFAAWASRGAGLFTDEILQTVRDPTSLSAQR